MVRLCRLLICCSILTTGIIADAIACRIPYSSAALDQVIHLEKSSVDSELTISLPLQIQGYKSPRLWFYYSDKEPDERSPNVYQSVELTEKVDSIEAHFNIVPKLYSRLFVKVSWQGEEGICGALAKRSFYVTR